MPFRDRTEAGRRLAPWLVELVRDPERTVVLGMPRGGVPVAFEVARAIDSPLDVLVVRKLGYPSQPELGLGAIGEGGVRLVNEELVAQLRVAPSVIDEVATREEGELSRRIAAYRGGLPPVPVEGRDAVVVDDGLATGFSARAGIEVLRRRGARSVVLAVPVAPSATVEAMRSVADAVVCLEQPPDFFGIGEWYSDFRQVSDEQVRSLLTRDSEVERSLSVEADDVLLRADVRSPRRARGVVVFAHGSGSGRLSPRNVRVARTLRDRGFATVLFDMLTPEESRERAKVFDVRLLGSRLGAAVRSTLEEPGLGGALGLFGASTGAAAALDVAARSGDSVRAVVCRGGRPDLATERLDLVKAPTLLVVGGRDDVVLELNRRAFALLKCPKRLEIVPGAGHLFEESGALEAVTVLAAGWFEEHLRAPGVDPRHDQPS